MDKKILVIGVNGFVGKHLARELHSSGISVIGVGLDSEASVDVEDSIATYVQCDLTEPEQINKIPLEEVVAVINLAAMANPGQSFNQEALYTRVNVETHTNLLDVLVKLRKQIRTITVSTGAVYDSHQKMPLTEDSGLTSAGSPYVKSKLMLEERLKDYDSSDLEVIIARPLNHTGPGQPPGFILPDLTSRILQDDELVVGPLNTSRDYTHVKDVVLAYRLLATHPQKLTHKVYNICSGTHTSRDELIALIEKETNRPKLPVKIDESIGRPDDPLILFGNHDRISQELGWEPKYSVAEIVADFVAWRLAEN